MADMATGESKANISTGTSAKELIDAMSDDDKKALKGWYWYDWFIIIIPVDLCLPNIGYTD